MGLPPLRSVRAGECIAAGSSPTRLTRMRMGVVMLVGWASQYVACGGTLVQWNCRFASESDRWFWMKDGLVTSGEKNSIFMPTLHAEGLSFQKASTTSVSRATKSDSL